MDARSERLRQLFGPYLEEHGLQVPCTPAGFPVRGDASLLTRGERRKAVHVGRVRPRCFDLSDPGDLKAYEETKTAIVNRLWLVIYGPPPVWDQQAGKWRAFVEWCEVEGRLGPQEQPPLAPSGGVSRQAPAGAWGPPGDLPLAGE